MIGGPVSALIGLVGLAAVSAAAGPGVNQTITLGRSVQGRSITAIERGDPRGPNVLVVGCIHGNETAGIRIVERLARLRPAPGVDLWLVPDLNPDGVQAQTRGNARGVDLNRNFPWHWRHLTGSYYSGSHPLSEPESRLAAKLILRLRPRLTIWFHQPLDTVDESGGSLAIEQRYAELSHLPLRRLTRFPGSATSWQNQQLPGSTAFVVELPRGTPTAGDVARYAHAVLKIAAEATTTGRG
jgi:murein peptide amidase A